MSPRFYASTKSLIYKAEDDSCHSRTYSSLQYSLLNLTMKRRFFVFVALTFAGIANGYIWALSSSAIPFLRPIIVEGFATAEDELSQSLAQSHPSNTLKLATALLEHGATLGYLVGFCVSWPVANKVGRKTGLQWINLLLPNALIFQVCGIEMTIPSLVILGQIVYGIQIGAMFSLCLLYAFETAPRSQRGSSLCAFLFLQLVAAEGMRFVVASMFPGGGEGPYQWEWVMAFSLVPGVFLVGLLYFCPESPGFSAVQRCELEKAEMELLSLTRCREVDEVILDLLTELPVDHLEISPVCLGVFLVILLWWFLFSSVIRIGVAAIGRISNSSFEKVSQDIIQSAEIAVGSYVATILTTALVTTAIVDRFRRRVLLFAACYALLIMNLAEVVLLTLLVSGGIESGDPVLSDIPKAVLLFWKVNSYLGIVLTIVYGSVLYVIILELGDQRRRAKVLVLPHILVVLMFGFVGIFASTFVKIVALAPYLMIVETWLLFAGSTGMTAMLWGDLPETGGKTVVEVSDQMRR